MKIDYHGHQLRCVDHPYNTTAQNERAVELAIAEHWLRTVNGTGIEVGDVLRHYDLGPRRLVVDRYAHDSDDVVAMDLFDIALTNVDWIISISTIEHVRHDPPEPHEPGGAVRAIQHLHNLLKPGGRMLITVPFGWNEYLDTAILGAATVGLAVARQATYRRDPDGWALAEPGFWAPYGATTPWAEAVWVGEWTN